MRVPLATPRATAASRSLHRRAFASSAACSALAIDTVNQPTPTLKRSELDPGLDGACMQGAVVGEASVVVELKLDAAGGDDVHAAHDVDEGVVELRGNLQRRSTRRGRDEAGGQRVL